MKSQETFLYLYPGHCFSLAREKGMRDYIVGLQVTAPQVFTPERLSEYGHFQSVKKIFKTVVCPPEVIVSCPLGSRIGCDGEIEGATFSADGTILFSPVPKKSVNLFTFYFPGLK